MATRARPSIRSALLLALASVAVASSAWAASVADMPAPTVAQPLRGPYVPPAARPDAAAAPTEGAALQAQVQAKLHAAFASADTAGTGRITRVQAAAHGLGFIDRNFEAIDSAHAGSVSYDDVAAFMHERAAQLERQR